MSLKAEIDAAYSKWAKRHPLRPVEGVAGVVREYRQRLIELNRRERELIRREKLVRWHETMVWADAIRDNSDLAPPPIN